MNMLTLQNTHPSLPPSLVDPRRADTVSAKYGFFDTRAVLETMLMEGWVLKKCVAARPRTKDPRSAKHMLVLQRANAALINGVTPQLLLINSHDGACTFQMYAAMEVFVCANGLIVTDGELTSRVKFRHLMKNVPEIMAAAAATIEVANTIADRIPKLAEITMTRQMMENYAYKAAKLLPTPKNYDDVMPTFITSRLRDSRELLTIHREADRGANLWSVFNVVQENLMRGKMNTAHIGRRRGVTRAVTNIQKNVDLNTGLWNLTLDAEKNDGYVFNAS
jgi:hypothetical protein